MKKSDWSGCGQSSLSDRLFLKFGVAESVFDAWIVTIRFNAKLARFFGLIPPGGMGVLLYYFSGKQLLRSGSLRGWWNPGPIIRGRRTGSDLLHAGCGVFIVGPVVPGGMC